MNKRCSLNSTKRVQCRQEATPKQGKIATSYQQVVHSAADREHRPTAEQVTSFGGAPARQILHRSPGFVNMRGMISRNTAAACGRRRTLLLIGSAAECPDIEYLTGFRAVDPVMLCRHGGKLTLVVPELEAGRAARGKPGVTVLTSRDLGLRGKRARSQASRAYELLKRLGGRKVSVPRSFPHGVARHLAAHGIEVSLLRGEACPQRKRKTREEVRRICESQQAAVIAMRAAVAAIHEADVATDGSLVRNGETLTSESVRSIVNRVLLDHQCVCLETIVAGGPQGADPHEMGSGALRAHEAIVLDIFPRHLVHGYWGDLTRTVVRGTPNGRLRKMYGAVRAAQAAGLNALRAGVSGDAVHAAVVSSLEAHGFGREVRDERPVGFIHSTGHGVGLAVHESPALAPGAGKLQAGNVVTVEPGLYYPELGGVRIEDTVVVTRDGWKYLVPCEKRFEA